MGIMKNHYLRASVFLLLLAAILVSLNIYFYSYLRSITTGDFGVWNKAVKGGINAQIIISGSSRALVHFDSDIIGKVTRRTCYNIGLDGTRYDLQYPMLLTYLKYNAKPEIIIQELDIHALSRAEGVFHPELYIPFINEQPVYSTLHDLDTAFWEDRYLPLYSFAKFGTAFREIFAEQVLAAPPENRINGYWPRDLGWGSEFDAFRQAHRYQVTYHIDRIEADALENIIKEAKTRRIAMVLVYSPEYYEGIGLTKNRKELFVYYRSLAAKYKIPLWDYSAIAITHSTEYFYNSQHLNKKGATIFSKIVAEDLRKYISSR